MASCSKTQLQTGTCNTYSNKTHDPSTRVKADAEALNANETKEKVKDL